MNHHGSGIQHGSNYNACFISMSDINTDSRLLNVVRVLVSNRKKVCVIAFGTRNDKDKFLSAGIDLFPIPFPKHNRAFRKWLYFNSQCKKILMLIEADAVWACDLFSLKPAIFLAERNNSKLFYDSREIYSAIGSLHDRKLAQKIQTWLEFKWVKRVNKVIVSGELDKEYLQKHFNINVPFVVIKNLPPFKEKIESGLLRKKFNISANRKIILYQGMLIRGRGIIPVIKAMPLIEDFVFCLIGAGDLEEEILRTAYEYNVSDRVFLAGIVNYHELHEWTCSTDIGVSIIEPVSLSYELALPNKLFEYCMAAVPAIVSDLPAMKNVVDTYGIGYVVKDSSPERIAEAIKFVAEEKNLMKYKSCCMEASRKLCYESQEDELLSIFNDINEDIKVV